MLLKSSFIKDYFLKKEVLSTLLDEGTSHGKIILRYNRMVGAVTFILICSWFDITITLISRSKKFLHQNFLNSQIIKLTQKISKRLFKIALQAESSIDVRCFFYLGCQNCQAIAKGYIRTLHNFI